jgi:hypothetical protein
LKIELTEQGFDVLEINEGYSSILRGMLITKPIYNQKHGYKDLKIRW